MAQSDSTRRRIEAVRALRTAVPQGVTRDEVMDMLRSIIGTQGQDYHGTTMWHYHGEGHLGSIDVTHSGMVVAHISSVHDVVLYESYDPTGWDDARYRAVVALMGDMVHHRLY